MLPLVYLVVRATTAGQAGWEYLFSTRTITITLNSVKLATAVTTSAAVVGTTVAWLTARTTLPLRKMWLVASLLPLVIPSFIGALAFIDVFGPRGVLHGVLANWGLAEIPSIYGFGGTWLTLTLFTYPYVLLPVRAALLNMDPALEETARSLGHSRWSTFWRITFPQLRPALATGMLLTALYSLSDFGAVSLLRFNAFTRAIFLQYTSSFDRSRAAILALVLILLALGLVALERKIAANRQNYRVGGASTARRARRVKLGLWTLPAMAFLAVILTLGLIVPAGVMIRWAIGGIQSGTAPLAQAFASSTINTVGISGITALTAGIAALPLAMLAIRDKSAINRWLVSLAYLGNSLPGLVVALALVFFAANYLPSLYQTFPLLIFGYLLRYLPFSIGATKSALTQVNPRYEEAGRSLGHSRLSVNRRVTLPLVRRGVISGMALVFLSVMKELPTTLLLAPTGFKTLAAQIWTAQNEAYLSQVGLPALLLIAVSAVSLVFVLKEDKGI